MLQINTVGTFHLDRAAAAIMQNNAPDADGERGLLIHTASAADDQEFVVAFEGDEPAVFLDLVQRLRTTESSLYTKRDTPTFTCVAMSVERALNALDGATATVTA